MNDLLTTKEAAKILCVSPAFLEKDRCYGARIPFVRVGTRGIRYNKDDLIRYIKNQTHN